MSCIDLPRRPCSGTDNGQEFTDFNEKYFFMPHPGSCDWGHSVQSLSVCLLTDFLTLSHFENYRKTLNGCRNHQVIGVSLTSNVVVGIININGRCSRHTVLTAAEAEFRGGRVMSPLAHACVVLSRYLISFGESPTFFWGGCCSCF